MMKNKMRNIIILFLTFAVFTGCSSKTEDASIETAKIGVNFTEDYFRNPQVLLKKKGN